jgi:hypothetical protein
MEMDINFLGAKSSVVHIMIYPFFFITISCPLDFVNALNNNVEGEEIIDSILSDPIKAPFSKLRIWYIGIYLISIKSY